MKFLTYTIAFMLVLFLVYRWHYPTYSWHQKMTVEVETPDGIKTGSSITSVSLTKGGNWTTGWRQKLKGEAVIVDMGDGRYLFALLRNIYNKIDMSLTFPAAISKRKGRDLRQNIRDEKLFAKVASKRDRASGVIELPEHLYPLLVTFWNIDDPTSVKKVEPYDLEQHFGNGVTLKRITLEVTDEPVTRGGLKKFLTWFSGFKGRLRPYSGPTRSLADMPVVDLIDRRDFRREF